MASSDKMKNDEFFEPGLIQPLIDRAKQGIETFNLLAEAIKRASQEATNIVNNTPATSVENIKRTNKAIDDQAIAEKGLNEVHKQRAIQEDKLVRLQSKAALEAQKLKERIAEQNKANKQRARDELGLTTEYQKQSRTLNELRNSYKNLELAGRSQGKVGRGLLQVVQEQDAKLKGLDATVGQHQRNVGHYDLALGKLGKGIKAAAGLVGELGQAFGINTEAMESLIRIGSAVSKTLKEIHHAQKLTKLVTQANTKATRQNTVEQQKAANLTGKQATATEAIANAQGKNAKATKLSTIEQLKLNWAIRANPYFLALVAITALIGGIASYIHYSEIAEEAERKRSTAIDGSIIKDEEARNSYNESIIVLQRLQVEWDLLTDEITETEAAVADLTISYSEKVRKLEADTQEKLTSASGFWNEFKNGFKDIGRLITDDDYGLTYGVGQTQKDIAEINANAARQAAIDKEEFEKEKALKVAEASKREQEEIAKNDEDARRRIRTLSNDIIKDTHTRNIAVINENADAARLDLINVKMSEYQKTALISAIMAKRDADIAKENEDYYKKNRDAVNNSEDKLFIDKVNHDKEDLQRKAQQDKKLANLTITDAVDLANERIQIESDLQDGLAAIDKSILELKAKRDIQGVKDSELSAATKKRLITDIETNLAAELAFIDKKVGQAKADVSEDEFENAIARMDEENERLIDNAEKNAEKLKALEKKKYDDLQRIRVLKAGTDEKAIRAAEAENEQEDYDRDLELLEAEHDAGIKSEEDYLRELELLNLEHQKHLQEIKKDSIDKLIGYEERLSDAIADGLRRRFDSQQKGLDGEADMIDKQLSLQQDLFARGMDNQLAFQEAEKARNLDKQAELEKRRQKAEQAQQLASVFLELLKGYAKEGNINAPAKALAETLIAKGIADAIAGSAYDGTPDTGGGANGWDDKGGQPWLIHPKEAIIPRHRNEQNPGLASAWISGDLDNYFRDIYLPQWAASIGPQDGPAGPQHSTESYLAGMVAAGLQSLEHTVRNKKELDVNWDSMGNLVRNEVQDGMRRITTKQRKF